MAQVFDQQPDIEASEERQERYDPWEAVEVVWDGGKSSSGYGGKVPGFIMPESRIPNPTQGVTDKMMRLWVAAHRPTVLLREGSFRVLLSVAKAVDAQTLPCCGKDQGGTRCALRTLSCCVDSGSADCILIGRVEAVNPWELEVDPDFERTEDEIKRDQEAEQRALRAAALAMRRCALLSFFSQLSASKLL